MDKDKLMKAIKKAKPVRMPTEHPGNYSRPSTGNSELDEMLRKSKPVKMPMYGYEDSNQKDTPVPNSVKQYLEEKKAGGALTDLSYEEWKKL